MEALDIKAIGVFHSQVDGAMARYKELAVGVVKGTIPRNEETARETAYCLFAPEEAATQLERDYPK